MLLFLVSALAFPGANPAANLFRSKTNSRNMDCERTTPAEGAQRRPGQVFESRSRGDYYKRSVVICRERMMRAGLRAPRDEAILTGLDDRTRAIADLAHALLPTLQDRTWLVETYFPSPSVSSKISFATKNALMKQGLIVSDRAVILGAADVDVLSRMPPEQAYPFACDRYFSTGSLRSGDVLLAVLARDPRETMLHGGLCFDGRWTWLQ